MTNPHMLNSLPHHVLAVWWIEPAKVPIYILMAIKDGIQTKA